MHRCARQSLGQQFYAVAGKQASGEVGGTMQWVGHAMPDLLAERILEGWGVPQDAWDGLLAGEGADQIHEIHDSLRVLLPIGTANGWMARPNGQPMFGGESPMRKLLVAGGLSAIHRLLVRQEA